MACHARRITISGSDTFRIYREEFISETLEQLFCICPALARARLSYHGVSQLKGLYEVSTLAFKALLEAVVVLYDDCFRSQ